MGCFRLFRGLRCLSGGRTLPLASLPGGDFRGANAACRLCIRKGLVGSSDCRDGANVDPLDSVFENLSVLVIEESYLDLEQLVSTGRVRDIHLPGDPRLPMR